VLPIVRRNRRSVVCAAALASVLTAQAAAAAGPEQELADRYSPVVALKKSEGPCGAEVVKGEPYRPTTVDIVLDNEEVTLRGPEKGHPVVKRAPTAADLYGKGARYFLNFPGNPLRPGCTYERDGKQFAAGRPSIAYAHIVTEPGVPDRLALEYWFYYYFNDFNDKHESDWEGIQLVFDVGTVEEALGTEPVEVGYAQHEGGERADWDSDKLEKVGGHPLVYSAAGSHASYYSERLWLGRGAAEGIGCDDTTGPSTQRRLRAVVVPTSPESRAGKYSWLAYEGLWGQRERKPNNGPTGPNTKDRWTAPITWQEELRERSVSVPTAGVLGESVTGAFCATVEFAAGVLNNFFDAPVWTILVIIAVLVPILVVVGRTTWSPAPLEPIRSRRAGGQILRTAGGLYLRHPTLFLALGAIVVVIEFLTVGFEAAVDAIIQPSGEGFELTFTPLAVALAGAAAAVLLRNLDSGRRLRVDIAYRLVLRKFWSLVGAVLLAAAVILVLFVSIVGIPWAIRRLVERAFVVQEVMLHGCSARSSQRATTELVRGNWWRSAAILLVLYAITVALGPIVGFVLLFTTSLPLVFVNVVGSALYVLVLPYTAIAACLLFFDLEERREESAVRAPRTGLVSSPT
jgi:hypothetical protein